MEVRYWLQLFAWWPVKVGNFIRFFNDGFSYGLRRMLLRWSWKLYWLTLGKKKKKENSF